MLQFPYPSGRRPGEEGENLLAAPLARQPGDTRRVAASHALVRYYLKAVGNLARRIMDRASAEVETMVNEIVQVFSDAERGIPDAIRINPSGSESAGVQVYWRIQGVLEAYTYKLHPLILFGTDEDPA